jgi:16S rRNA processing protein RimM
VQLVAGRVARVHGLRGEVLVEIRTDDPDERFAVGAVLATEPVESGPLTIEARRWHQGRLLVRFVGVPDRNAAETLPGVRLVVEVDGSDGREDEFYDHELEGLRVLDGSGTQVGTVAAVLHHTGQELLVVRRPTGEDVLVPFVSAIVTTVDLAGGRIVLDAPPGLLDADAIEPDPVETGPVETGAVEVGPVKVGPVEEG